MRLDLPIDAQLAAVTAAVRASASVIIKAAPGAGKTTRVPPALLPVVSGRIVVLEPRRLAARLSAVRIASELGEEVGATCGYQVRYEGQSSAATRILFVTEGVFTRMLVDDPTLKGVGAVILDEFHERHVHTDVALAMARRLVGGARPDLKLVVMSATIDTAALEAYLPDAKVFDVEGRTYPVAVEHLLASGEPELPTGGRVLEDRIVAAVEKMVADPRCPGNVLVFLSGMQEIRRVESALNARPVGRAATVLPLAADLPPAAQARVFAPSDRRKIVLATNVAETSLTLPGITGVVDPGFAKVAGHASWSGLPTLDVRKISQASCIQRAGRAGRTGPGVTYRLYSEPDFRSRPAFTPPDIRRLDLADTCLEVKMMLAGTPQAAEPFETALPWLEPPEPRAVASAQSSLTLIGALDAQGALTPLGRRLARLPLGPRLGAVVVCGKDLGIGAEATLASVLLGERALGGGRGQAHVAHDCDLLHAMSRLGDLDPGLRRRIEQAYFNLARQVGIPARLPELREFPDERFADFTTALLAGFPDRVARRREAEAGKRRDGEASRLYNLCLGRGAVLSDASVVRDAEWILALDASESVVGRSADRSTLIHVASRVDPALLALAPGGLATGRDEMLWMDDAQRVDAFRSTYYGQLCVSRERARIETVDPAEVEELLRAKLAERWPKPFEDDSDLSSYHARREFLAQHGLPCDLPKFEGEMLELLLAAICEGKRSFKEIAARELSDYIDDQLGYADVQRFAKLAPLTIANRAGRKLKVRYEVGKPPWIQGMIQDFYGMSTTPTLLDGRLPVTLHLMAPSKRPIQVTSDLAGFWRNAYPDVKRELGRRYPRHNWPDDPATAEPALHKPRGR
jgi:ATP-dependent helicase HrpB